MARKGFTLIELLVIIAIMATMVTVGVVGMNSSRASTRLFGAARDVMSMVRRARSLALVTQQPVVLTYSTEHDSDGAYAKVVIEAKKLFSSGKGRPAVYNLAGDVVAEAVPASDSSEGETLEDVLAPESIPIDVVRGLKILAVDESDLANLPENETRKSKISIFSTADNVSQLYSEPKTSDDAQEVGKSEVETFGEELDAQPPLKVVFAVNGTLTPPHRIYLYREESTYDSGICIRVDRFGEPKCEEFE